MPSIPLGSDWIPELRSETSRFFFPLLLFSLFFLGLVGIKPCRFLKGILCIGGHHLILACLVLLSNLCLKGLVHAFGRVALTLE